jgi:hypothetical protein
MTYVTGGLIQAADYNGFVSTTVGANINATWNSAYGQPALSNVVVGGTVTAAQWATLNTTISQLGAHQGTTITSRTNPVAGNIISVLANVNTDITNCYNNRNNAFSVGAQYTSWTGSASFTSGIGNTAGNVNGKWTATFTDTVTFSNASAASSFFNAGGLIKVQFSKTSTGTTGDTAWNSFITNTVANVGVFLSGANTAHTIAGQTYYGTTARGGGGTPSILASATGFFNLTTAPTPIYKQYPSGGSYSSNYVQITAAVNSNTTPTTLTLVTTWYENGEASVTTLTGGTATTGIAFGTAAATIVTYTPPESTYITNVWGTPTVFSAIANT